MGILKHGEYVKVIESKDLMDQIIKPLKNTTAS